MQNKFIVERVCTRWGSSELVDKWRCLSKYEVYLAVRCALFGTMVGISIYSFGKYVAEGDAG